MESPPATILEHLVLRFPQVSAATWRSRIARGLVTTANGARVSEESGYAHGLMVFYIREVSAEPLPSEVETILYEDEQIVAADKPHGMVVTPVGDHVARSLLHRLQERSGIETLAPLHRIDKDTAGIVIFCIKPESRAAYHELFARNAVRREYLALSRMDTEPGQTRWRVENRLAPGTPWFRQKIVTGTVNAITEIELLEVRDRTGLFLLRPQTGKKHQLRVHMASLGFPIFGDALYSEPGRSPETSLQLLAKRLSFTDPITGVPREFESRRKLNQG